MEFNNILIKGTGKALPRNSFSNEEIVAWHGKKSPEWIYQKIGVRSRFSLFDFETEEVDLVDEDDLAFNASIQALTDAKLSIDEIDAVIMSTSTPSHLVFPDSSCTLHDRLGARKDASAFTLTSGCAGILNGLIIGNSLIKSNQAENVLVCGASTMSSFFKPHLKEKIWLHSSIFGDGVSALVLGNNTRIDERNGFTKFFMGADQSLDVAKREWGGSKKPIDPVNLDFVLNDYLEIDFRSVPTNLENTFNYIYDNLTNKLNGVTRSVDHILFNMSNSVHQMRWVEKKGLDTKKAFFNMINHGNCAAASLGISIHDFLKSKRDKPDDVAIIMSVGTGLQYGGALYKF